MQESNTTGTQVDPDMQISHRIIDFRITNTPKKVLSIRNKEVKFSNHLSVEVL